MAKTTKKKARTTRAATAAAVAPQAVNSAERSVLDNAELLSNIFQYLKEPTRPAQAVPRPDEGWPTAPPRIKAAAFALLATVNRAFFHASVEVLWENMDSVIPFLGHVLPADKDVNGRPDLPLHYHNEHVTAKHWERFAFYASKTKYLVLNRPERVLFICSGWLCYVVNSADRPRILFPNLRHLVARSPDILSLFVASNAAKVLKVFDLNLELKTTEPRIEHARSLTVGLARDAQALTCLRLIQPVTPNIIEDVSRIQSLSTLHILISPDSTYIPLSPLAKLPALEELRIVQAVKWRDRKVAEMLPPNLNIQPLISQQSKLKNLKELHVRANGTTQYLIASELLPQSLETLELEPLPDVLNVQMLLIPLVVALYAHRNRSLVSLRASMSNEMQTEVNVDALEPLRADPRFKIDPFITGLSKLQHLGRLAVWGLPFIDADITVRLLEVAQALPSLYYVAVMPERISELPADDLALPPLQSLEALSRCSPRLRVLQTWVDITDIPPIPRDHASRHGLEQLSLITKPPTGYQTFTTQHKFGLVQYLDALFPNASLESWGGDSPEGKFWGFMEESLSFLRKGRSDPAMRP